MRVHSKAVGMAALHLVIGVLLPRTAVPQGEPPPIEWELSLTGRGEATAFDIVPSGDGGIVAVGDTHRQGSTTVEAYLVKVGIKGQIVWERFLLEYKSAGATSIRPTADGGFIIAGQADDLGQRRADGLLIKTDATGEVQWKRTYNAQEGSQEPFISDVFEEASSVRPTSDGGYLFLMGVGFPDGTGDSGIHLCKVDAEGANEWRKPHPDVFPQPFDVNTIILDRKGGIVWAGYHRDGSRSTNAFLMHLNLLGEEEWVRDIQSETGKEFVRGLVQVSDGGFAMTGGTKEGLIVLKTNEEGRFQWDVAYDAEHDPDGPMSPARGQFVLPSFGDGFLAIGMTKEQSRCENLDGQSLFGVQTNRDGAIQWKLTHGAECYLEPYAAAQSPDAGFVVAGISYEGSASRAYLLKFGAEVLPEAAFRRTDSNADGEVNLTDAVFTLVNLFQGGPAPSCLDSADADDNGRIDLTDAVYTLNHLFIGGSPPAPPADACGADPTADDMDCGSFPPCKA